MEGQDRRALVGLHNLKVMKPFVGLFQNHGFEVDTATTEEEAVRKAREKEYDACLMDINLGRPVQPYITPSQRVYEIMKQRCEAGQARFLAISGLDRAVELAKSAGIPATLNTDFKIINGTFFEDG